MAGATAIARSWNGATNRACRFTQYAAMNSLAALTLAAWVYRADLGGSSLGVIASKDDGAGLSEFRLTNVDDGSGNSDLLFEAGRWNGTAGVFRWAGLAFPIPASAWHHLAVTYAFSSTANVPTLYLDGVAQGAPGVDAAPVGTAASVSYDLILGNNLNNGNRNWGGATCQTCLWSRALDTAELTTLGAKGFDARFVLRGMVFGAPLWGNQNPEVNWRNSASGTLTAAVATSQVGPRLFVPDSPTVPRFVEASNSRQLILPPPLTGMRQVVGNRRLRRQIIVPLP